MYQTLNFGDHRGREEAIDRVNPRCACDPCKCKGKCSCDHTELLLPLLGRGVRGVDVFGVKELNATIKTAIEQNGPLALRAAWLDGARTSGLVALPVIVGLLLFVIFRRR